MKSLILLLTCLLFTTDSYSAIENTIDSVIESERGFFPIAKVLLEEICLDLERENNPLFPVKLIEKRLKKNISILETEYSDSEAETREYFNNFDEIDLQEYMSFLEKLGNIAIKNKKNFLYFKPSIAWIRNQGISKKEINDRWEIVERLFFSSKKLKYPENSKYFEIFIEELEHKIEKINLEPEVYDLVKEAIGKTNQKLEYRDEKVIKVIFLLKDSSVEELRELDLLARNSRVLQNQIDRESFLSIIGKTKIVINMAGLSKDLIVSSLKVYFPN